jgi:hypothetical protein
MRYLHSNLVAIEGLEVGPTTAMLLGHEVKTAGLRVRVILEERACANPACSHVATHAGLTRNQKGSKRKYHVNFYSVTEHETRLMTLDHVIPRSAGGRHSRANTQAMCVNCNEKKGSDLW